MTINIKDTGTTKKPLSLRALEHFTLILCAIAIILDICFIYVATKNHHVFLAYSMLPLGFVACYALIKLGKDQERQRAKEEAANLRFRSFKPKNYE